MRLFGYYAIHSFVNQLKKLFKTWLLLFIVACGLIGGLIGYGAATLSEMAEEQDEGIVEVDPGSVIEELPFEDPTEPAEAEAWPEWLTASAIVELVAGGVVLALLVFEALSADKNGSAIFLPADVNVLFSAPMKPQSVLMFRLMTQLGVALVSGIYMLFQLPNLTLNAGLSIWSALALVAAYCLMIMFGKLVQLLLYMLGSTYPRVKRMIHPVTYGVLALIGLGYFACWRASGTGALEAAARFFNAPGTRLIPIWGWIKGFCAYACEGSILGCVGLAAVMAAAIVLMVFAIWRIKVDFYEDAMAKSEETAALLAEAQEKGIGIAFRKKKKDRSESLRRDGMNHGWGASVFFFKTMYNRFRFARFGVLTKTSGTYFVAAVGAAALLRFVIESESIVPVALALAVLVFYRSLGNPLAGDTKMDYFRAIPESPWKKVFFSLLGGGVSCLLDLLPGMLAAMLILRASPLSTLAWMLFIVSVDFYSTTIGVFIDLSVPVAAGKMVKQFAQVLFIYFGLLPDIAILAVGFVKEEAAMATAIAAAFNVVLGLIFSSVAPLFLEPGSRRVSPVALSDEELAEARRSFSRAGLALFVMLVLTTLVQVVLALALQGSSLMDNPYTVWVITFAPLYLVAVPVGLWMLKKLPANRPEDRPLGAARFVTGGVIGVFLMYAGAFVSSVLLTLINSLGEISSANPLESFAMDDSLVMRILVPVILAPLVEEYIFRRQLIDRLRIYGGKLAVVISALAFGLFHGNLFQSFYAFTLGLLFGYLYLNTGRLRYSVALHMIINFFGMIVAPWMLERADLENLDPNALAAGEQTLGAGQIGFLLYVAAVLVLAAAGFVLLCIRARRLDYPLGEREIQRGKRFKTAYLNAGMLLLTAAALVMTVISTMTA